MNDESIQPVDVAASGCSIFVFGCPLASTPFATLTSTGPAISAVPVLPAIE